MWTRYRDKERTIAVQNEITESINEVRASKKGSETYEMPSAGVEKYFQNILENALELSTPAEILPEYKQLYEQNTDIIGYLKIADTIIDYPVMQTMDILETQHLKIL